MESARNNSQVLHPDDRNLYTHVDDSWDEHKTELISKWADMAQSYGWMHQNAAYYYRLQTNIIIIPVIILSTITGISTATFGSLFAGDSYVHIQPYISIGLGFLSIIVAIMNTIEQKFRFSQKAERHSFIGKEWNSFWRMLHSTLMLDPRERTPFRYFFEKVHHILDNLSKNRPDIPEHSITAFMKIFGQIQGLRLPPECRIMHPTTSHFVRHADPAAGNQNIPAPQNETVPVPRAISFFSPAAEPSQPVTVDVTI